MSPNETSGGEANRPALPNDVARDNAGARLQVRRQSSSDAKTQDTMTAFANRGLERAPELYLPTAANDGNAGTGHDAGFKCETRCSYQPPVGTTQ
jgi:hypothetical protein